ncbi:MAG: sigma-54-dependent Fis family transcriptional regulator [Anaerovoracaceae bacterium]|jgi:transcriptional regulator with PAS, ATPase and Fis domain
MQGLETIQKSVIQVADAITAALDMETEIVDHNLKIIGGTGRYVRKIGSYEEDGDLDSGLLYAEILRSGREYVCMETQSDPFYDQLEGELAEIACPIRWEDKIIGIIGLVAFTEEQRSLMRSKQDSFLQFLRRMSELITEKLAVSQSNFKLASVLESMPEGLIATDQNKKIFSCNYACSILLDQSKEQLLQRDIRDVFHGDHFFARSDYTGITEKETTYRDAGSEKRLLFKAISMPGIGFMYLFQDATSAAVKAMRTAFLHTETTFDDITATSEEMILLKQRAIQVSPNNSTIMITGESGTGKEFLARAIHNASDRAGLPFVPINCGAIPEALLESELFGYEKGAFTGASPTGKIGKFQLAEKGTLFLDEIGDMPLHLQVKLLHVLQNRSIERVGGTSSIDIDVRIIAATNKDLETMVKKEEFREDLFFRLNVIPLHVPPLRDRGGDISSLLDNSLDRFRTLLHKSVKAFDTPAKDLFLAYHWPGNIRELENTVEYAVNMAKGDRITVEDLPPRILTGREFSSEATGSTLREQTDAAQKSIIASCLSQTGTSLEGKRLAAQILGISESTLYRKLRELNMQNRF